MRVGIDLDQCEGNARCQAAAPRVFEVRDDDRSYVLVDEVPEALVEAVNRAIRVCPKQAIAWLD